VVSWLPGANEIVVSEVVPKNAYSPIEVKLAGSVIEVMAVPSNP
jgi:hypothetical protein